jgi:hypothetical protein
MARADGALSERIVLCAGGSGLLDRVNGTSVLVEHPITWRVAGSDLELRDRNGVLDNLHILSRLPRSVAVRNHRHETISYQVMSRKEVICSAGNKGRP